MFTIFFKNGKWEVIVEEAGSDSKKIAPLLKRLEFFGDKTIKYFIAVNKNKVFLVKLERLTGSGIELGPRFLDKESEMLGIPLFRR